MSFFPRRICSFVRREGRMTGAQRAALTDLWPQYGREIPDHPVSPTQWFGRAAPCILEIGFGMGDSFLAMAEAMPDHNFIGVEVHRPGVGALLSGLHQHAVKNVRVFCTDAVDVLTQAIPDESLAGVQIFFPDPWPKKRHHKRRIVQPVFAALVWRKLVMGGTLHLATDWQAYAEHMLNVLQNTPGFINTSETNTFVPRPSSRPLTKFELRGQRLGHGTWDLIFKKQPIKEGIA